MSAGNSSTQVGSLWRLVARTLLSAAYQRAEREASPAPPPPNQKLSPVAGGVWLPAVTLRAPGTGTVIIPALKGQAPCHLTGKPS